MKAGRGIKGASPPGGPVLPDGSGAASVTALVSGPVVYWVLGCGVRGGGKRGGGRGLSAIFFYKMV